MTGVIDAKVIAASVAAGVGGTTGVGASIGIAVARNFIGWEPDASTTFTYLSTERPATLLGEPGEDRQRTAHRRRVRVQRLDAQRCRIRLRRYDDMSEATVVAGGIVAGTRVKRTSDGKVFRYAPAYDYVSTATLTDGLAARRARPPRRPCLRVRRRLRSPAPVDLSDADLSRAPTGRSSPHRPTSRPRTTPIPPSGRPCRTASSSRRSTTPTRRSGSTSASTAQAAVVEAKVENASVHATGALTAERDLDADDQAIVVAGSVAIGGGGHHRRRRQRRRRIRRESHRHRGPGRDRRRRDDGDRGREHQRHRYRRLEDQGDRRCGLDRRRRRRLDRRLRSRSGSRSRSTRSTPTSRRARRTPPSRRRPAASRCPATTAAAPPFSSSAVTAAQLDDVAESDDTVADWNGDAVIRQSIVTMFAANAIVLATTDTVSTAALYTTADGTKSLKTGDLSATSSPEARTGSSALTTRASISAPSRSPARTGCSSCRSACRRSSPAPAGPRGG